AESHSIPKPSEERLFRGLFFARKAVLGAGEGLWIADFPFRVFPAKIRGHMTPDQLKDRIQTLAPGTDAEIIDLTGTMDHYQAIIVSPAFEGKMMIEQHRMVMKILQSEIDSGEVHALTMRTFTPVQYQKFM